MYKKFFESDLGIDAGFLNGHADTIRQRLNRAVDEMARDHSNIFAVNMCLHAASSIVLSKPDNLKQTLDGIRNTAELREKDPTTVLTVSALYYLIEWESGRAKSKTKSSPDKPDEAKSDETTPPEDSLTKLRRNLDDINWMIGKDAMRVLGLNKVDA